MEVPSGPRDSNTDGHYTVIGQIIGDRSIIGFWVSEEEATAVMDWWVPMNKSSIEVSCVGNNKASRKRQFLYGGGFAHLMEVYEMKHEATNNQNRNLSDGT